MTSGFRPPNFGGGSGGDSGTTYGPLTNIQILAIALANDEDTAFSTDDNVVYTYFSGNWYNPVGGILS